MCVSFLHHDSVSLSILCSKVHQYVCLSDCLSVCPKYAIDIWYHVCQFWEAYQEGVLPSHHHLLTTVWQLCSSLVGTSSEAVAAASLPSPPSNAFFDDAIFHSRVSMSFDSVSNSSASKSFILRWPRGNLKTPECRNCCFLHKIEPHVCPFMWLGGTSLRLLFYLYTIVN